ncbi:hypothetical protein [Shigella phage ESh18]|nr:hypothetical protein [Shigella phage ESh17]URY12172.1 hypothetical protein [Shigella phage ESh18]
MYLLNVNDDGFMVILSVNIQNLSTPLRACAGNANKSCIFI